MAKNKKEPIAFLSYVRDDDKRDSGRLSKIREDLSAEVKMQTGEEFLIFQDRNDIKWGQNWKERIDDTIDAVTFFIPIITPSFFNSVACCDELEKFVKLQKKLKRNDLILPIYYVSVDLIDDVEKREKNKIAKILHEHQHKDWRELRHKPFTDSMISMAFTEMAIQIKEAIGRVENGDIKTIIVRKKKKPKTKKTAIVLEEISSAETLTTTKSEESSVQRTEIPTITVDALHRGDFPTISEAIKAAEPGTRILIRPGLYNEGLIIDKPLEIIGHGEREHIVIQVKDKDVINFISSMGKVSNLTLKQLGGKYFAVDIAQGRLDIEDCDITSAGLSNIKIHNWADPRIRRNIIHDGNEAGILVHENGQGTIEDNDIFNNANSGIVVGNGGNSLIRKNKIWNNKASGIFAHNKGKVTIEDNEIFNNVFSGIEVKENADALIRKNRIRDGKTGGIYIHTNGRGTIEDNDIFNNVLTGIVLTENADALIRKNKIRDGKEGGIMSSKNGKGTIEDNDIFNNAFSGIVLTENGDVLIRKNRIKDGKQNGIMFAKNGQGTVEDNDIFNNAFSGIEIKEGANPVIRKNRIRDGNHTGISVHEFGQGTIEDNDIFNNTFSGIAVGNGGDPLVLKNKINNNSKRGIKIYEKGKGKYENNDLTNNIKGPWDISEDSKDLIERKGNIEK